MLPGGAIGHNAEWLSRPVASGLVGSGLMVEPIVVVLVDEFRFAVTAGDGPSPFGGATRGGPQVHPQ